MRRSGFEMVSLARPKSQGVGDDRGEVDFDSAEAVGSGWIYGGEKDAMNCVQCI